VISYLSLCMCFNCGVLDLFVNSSCMIIFKPSSSNLKIVIDGLATPDPIIYSSSYPPSSEVMGTGLEYFRSFSIS
jgi:hypothetical protein